MIALVASVLIGGLFGSATATVESVESDVMLIDIEVEVTPSVVGSVVAHFTFDGEPDLTLPLIERGDGLYGIRTELEPKNYFVVFEVIGEEAGSSDPVSLTEMGAELGAEAGPPSTDADDNEGLDDESSRMLWLAVALGAASLSALAFWVLGGRDEEEGQGDEGDKEEATEPEVASDQEE